MAQTVDAHPAGGIPWRASLDDALQEAGRSGKFVLLDFFNPG